MYIVSDLLDKYQTLPEASILKNMHFGPVADPGGLGAQAPPSSQLTITFSDE